MKNKERILKFLDSMYISQARIESGDFEEEIELFEKLFEINYVEEEIIKIVIEYQKHWRKSKEV